MSDHYTGEKLDAVELGYCPGGNVGSSDSEQEALLAVISEVRVAFATARALLSDSASARKLEGEERFLAEVSTARLVLERMDHRAAVIAMERQQEIEKLEAVYGGRIKIEEASSEQG